MTDFMLCIFYPPPHPPHKLLNLLSKLREYKSKRLLKFGARGCGENCAAIPPLQKRGDGCREPAAHPKSRERGLKDTSRQSALCCPQLGSLVDWCPVPAREI